MCIATIIIDSYSRLTFILAISYASFSQKFEFYYKYFSLSCQALFTGFVYSYFPS